MLGTEKVDKLPIYDTIDNKLTKWILIGQYLDIIGATNSNMHAKFEVALLEEKILIWWHIFS